MTRRPRTRKRAARKNQTPGSSLTGEPVFLAVGRLGKPHGIRGEIKMLVLTDFPDRLKPNDVVYVGDERQPRTLRAVRPHQGHLLVAFEGLTDREQASRLRQQFVCVHVDNVPPLPDGEYYHHQLIGLQIITENGAALGKLAEIIETGANDVYIIRPEDGKDILIPAIDDVILTIDLEARTMLIRVMPGLLPD